jgi:Matrixin
MMRSGNVRTGCVIVAIALAAPACFYDSRWADPKRAQEAAAKRATPSALKATSETEIGPDTALSPRPTRAYRLRAWATPRYAAEVVDWPRQLEHLTADANDILGPTLGIRLEIAGTATWSPRAGDEDLATALDDLAGSDAGEGADWVLGLAGSTPRAELSFHQLGIGRLGKHLVTRAMNDAREQEAIEQNLSKLSDDERHKLYRVRKRHKTTAVFLHEIGHTLGLIHETAATTIMHPSYDSKMEGYSPAAVGFMRIVLDHRLDPAAQAEPVFFQALLDQVQKAPDGWVAAEREELLTRLNARIAPPPAPAAATPSPSPSTSSRTSRGRRPTPPPPVEQKLTAEDLGALRPEDRATILAADEDRRAGRAADGWKKAAPLFAAYPDVYPVQDLRCKLAMAKGGAMDAVNAECARLLELAQGAKH